MAKIFPEELSNRTRKDPKKRAEIKLYDALQQQLPGSWHVFYSVAWLGRTSTEGVPRDGETDFIVVHPNYGILLIEVKGGQISYEGTRRQWISTDQGGNSYDIDPFNQVIRCKYALINKLKSLPRWSKNWINIVHAVAFPDIYLSSSALPPEAPPEIILDADDLPNIEKHLKNIFEYWKGHYPNTSKPDPQFALDLERLLAPTIKLRNPLVLQVEDEYQEILRLTDEQCRTLNTLNRVRRAEISGCAGSGKTMMAVEKAKRLASEGFRTLLTCYNKPLAEHLTEVSGNLANLTVCTFHQLCHKMAHQAGIPLPDPNEGNPTRVFEHDYPTVLLEAMTLQANLRFDAIIVDEGQDFAEGWWIALESCLAEGRQSVFYIFYDDNQRIYRDRGSIPDYLNLTPVSLQENVRNTRTIHHTLASYYTGENASLPRGPVGRSIEIHNCATDNDLYKNLSQVLNKLTRIEGISCKDIVLLTPKSLKANFPHHSIVGDFKFNGNLRLVQKVRDPSNEILCSTIHSFKGLERPIVIVVEIDEFFIENNAVEKDALCYVAFSRPRSHLILLGKQPIITELLPKAR
jgi:Nuclease-related domain/AAA domain/UvrD-like helicase C-terminal domain